MRWTTISYHFYWKEFVPADNLCSPTLYDDNTFLSLFLITNLNACKLLFLFSSFDHSRPALNCYPLLFQLFIKLITFHLLMCILHPLFYSSHLFHLFPSYLTLFPFHQFLLYFSPFTSSPALSSFPLLSLPSLTFQWCTEEVTVKALDGW